jgi:hypothetical protein
MPVTEADLRHPYWIRVRDRYTIAGIENDKAVFMNYEDYPRNYRGGDFPQAGYNPNHNSTRVERVNLRQWDYTLKPR